MLVCVCVSVQINLLCVCVCVCKCVDLGFSFQMGWLADNTSFHSNISEAADLAVAVVYSIFGEYTYKICYR